MIYTATRGGAANQFTAADADTGLLVPARVGGQGQLQIKINSVIFSTASTITGWEIALVNGAFSCTWQTGSTTDFVLADTNGILLVPNTDTDQPWSIAFTTDTMAGAGTVWIDYEIVGRQSP